MQVLIKHAANGEVNRGTTEEREREREETRESALSEAPQESQRFKVSVETLAFLWQLFKLVGNQVTGDLLCANLLDRKLIHLPDKLLALLTSLDVACL